MKIHRQIYVVDTISTQRGARTMTLGHREPQYLYRDLGVRPAASRYAGKSAAASDAGSGHVHAADLRQIESHRVNYFCG